MFDCRVVSVYLVGSVFFGAKELCRPCKLIFDTGCMRFLICCARPAGVQPVPYSGNVRCSYSSRESCDGLVGDSTERSMVGEETERIVGVTPRLRYFAGLVNFWLLISFMFRGFSGVNGEAARLGLSSA